MPEASPTNATGGELATRRVVFSRRLVVAAVLAFAGAVETAWLTITWLQHGHVPCVVSARLDCAALFMATGTAPLGLPLTVWGHAAYAVAMALALAALMLEPPAAARARAGFATLAIGMAGTSVFLMLRMLSLGALCPWCMLSAALSLSLGGLAILDVARGGAGWRYPACGVLLAGAMVTLALTTGARAAPPAAGDVQRLAALARHLSSSGARFYGVWWCTACREQKDLFGAAAPTLPYVECSRDSAPADVGEFPTWDIAGNRLIGVQPVETLAVRSGFSSR